MKNVKIYTTPTCGFCHMAKNWMKEKGINYEEIDVSTNPSAAQEMISKSGQMGVPVIDVDGDITVGFDRPKLENILS